jgi:L-rhamnose-H+ transport protein
VIAARVAFGAGRFAQHVVGIGKALFLHALGGMAAASFYAPLKFIRKWPWESFYLAMGVFAWLCTPWIFASVTTPDLLGVVFGTSAGTLGLTFLFGLLWGVGTVTFGLSMRYLGMALGMSVTLGFCALFGTLIPPLAKGEFGFILASLGGRVVLGGVAVCALGIAVSGYAGIRKEREMPAQVGKDDKSGDNEFALGKGLIVAFVSGLMSACFAFGLQTGGPIAARAAEAGANPLFQNNAVLCVILAGGFVTNTLWCLILNQRNRSFASYRAATARQTTGILLLCALAGVVWYFQFFFYGMGTTLMGAYEFSSWTLHMASIIMFSTIWGIILHEWKGTRRRTHVWIAAGLIALALSTIIIGWGNLLGASVGR